MLRIAAILLAAGTATRFGADKRLSPVGDERVPMVVGAWRRLQRALPHTVAVVRDDDDPAAVLLREAGARTVGCARAREGMGASLACGVAATRDADGWLVALGDMPWIEPATIEGVAGALRSGAMLAAPFHRGVRGHPVGFGAIHRAALLALSGDEGARAIVAAHLDSLVALEVDDPGVLRDVDRPADLGDR